MSLLQAQQLHFSYHRSKKVIDGIDLNLKRGELLGIIGPNGSGKSTVLKIIAGILKPDQGSINLDQQKIESIKRIELAKQISFLPQTLLGSYDYTCAEVVAQGRYPYSQNFRFLAKSELELIERYMELTDTLQFATRRINDLSGGERQRVFLASILVQQTQFLLLDEPTTSLDLNHQAELFALLLQFKNKETGIAVTIHDLNLAAEFCDRLVLINQGKIIAEGVASEVLTQENLKKSYGEDLIVTTHPITNNPLVTITAHTEN